MHGSTYSRYLTGRSVAIALCCLTGLFTALNADLPILRNAEVYAKTTYRLLDHDGRFWEVCPSTELTHGKGCGFPLFAAPWVAVFEANIGMKIASWVSGALFIFSALAFFRRFNARFGLSARDEPLELVLAFFNPLTIYLFWSAYAEPLFGAAFVASFVLLDRVIHREARTALTALVAYPLVMIVAVTTKHHGLLLFPMHVVMLLWNRGVLWRHYRASWRSAVPVVIGLAIPVSFMVLAWFGRNPLLNVRGSSSELGKPAFFLSNIKELMVFAVVAFSVLPGVALFRTRVTSANIMFLVLGLIYVNAMLGYEGARYNMRYYAPLLPFFAPFIVSALRNIAWRRVGVALCGAHVSAMAIAILNYNAAPIYRALAPINASLPDGFKQPLENLRMSAHLAERAALENINDRVPSNATLYFVSGYYRDATYYVYERSGLIRDDITVNYGPAVNLIDREGRGLEPHVPEAAEFFVFNGALRDDRPLPMRGMVGRVVTREGTRLYRVTSKPDTRREDSRALGQPGG